MIKNLLIIGFVWPEPETTAAGSRMMQLIQCFIKSNYKITFACSASHTDYSYDLKKLNVKSVDIQINSSDFDNFLKVLNPEIVMFDRYFTEEQFGWRVSEVCPNALRILDTEDLHFLRRARQTAFKKNIAFSNDLLFNDLARREIASIYRCDLSLIISKFEMNILKKVFQIDRSILCYLPFMVEQINPSVLITYPKFDDRQHFMTIGNFRHEPNWHSVLYLKNSIWPFIRKQLPEAQMHIYGSYSTKKVVQLHDEKSGFLIKGFANSSEEVFKKAKVCLAPLQYGAGLKGKLIDAMKFGTPSVTTTIGAESMHAQLPWNGYINDDSEEFANKAVSLYTDKVHWQKFQKNGINILNSCFSLKKNMNKFSTQLSEIQTELDKHRHQNFMGSMLLYHTLKSTKYMSKWIEEKNKNMPR